MDMTCRSVWHAGGTRAPSWMKWDGSPGEFRCRRAAEVVPFRAIGDVSRHAKDLVRRTLQPSGARSGTEWHDRPRESTQGHRRAR